MSLRRRLLQGCAVLCLLLAAASARAQDRPNILWLSSEDNGRELGAYGDAYATTPNLDRLASRGVRYTRAWAPAPVCAPSRTAIITGIFQQATGGHHMRSDVPLPADVRMFPSLLRKVGYHTSNNVKEDYNHPTLAGVWDDSSATAHWRTRRPGQPFFAVFNSVRSHESQVRKRPHVAIHDPARVRVPPFHPDTPDVRRDWAQYYDMLTEMDAELGRRLQELEADGLAESTIVFYWGDHGVGLPRGKRWLYPAGLDVPLIVYVPERWRPLAPPGYAAGAALDRLVSLIDLGPTALSLAGVRPPATMQGRAFMGAHVAPPREWLAAGRDRMDERIDLSRAVTDGRHLYIRNFRPDRRQGEYLAYMFETPTTRVWQARYEAGGLPPAQRGFWEPKPAEELYDLQVDPDAVRNLAGEDAHTVTLQRCREALAAHLAATRDLGFLPEVDMHRRRATRSPFELSADRAAYPFDRVFSAADRASRGKPEDLPGLVAGLRDSDPAVRYWSAVGIRLRGTAAVGAQTASLRTLLTDAEPAPRVAAADALMTLEDDALRAAAVEVLLALADYRAHGRHAAMLALDTLVAHGGLSDQATARVRALPRPGVDTPQREREYIPRLIDALTAP